jgi:hypothetical protein
MAKKATLTMAKKAPTLTMAKKAPISMYKSGELKYRKLHITAIDDITDNEMVAKKAQAEAAKTASTADDAPAAKANDPTVTISALTGKMTVRTVKKGKHVALEGGEINLYRWGAAGGAAAYCGTQECLEAIPDTVELKEVKEMIRKAINTRATIRNKTNDVPH